MVAKCLQRGGETPVHHCPGMIMTKLVAGSGEAGEGATGAGPEAALPTRSRLIQRKIVHTK